MSRLSFKTIVAVATSLFFTAVAVAAPEIKTLEIGAKAPNFRLPGVDGKMHRLAEYDKAKVLVIVFTCNHCPTAQAYEERIKKLAADYKDKGVALVAISPNDAKAVRLDELGYTDLGRFARRHEDSGQGQGLQLPVPVRRRQAGGLPGLRPGLDAACLCLRQ